MSDFNGPGCLVAVVGIALAVLVAVVWSALAVGAANSWVLQGNFVDGWHAAWGRPLPLIGWAILFVGGIGGASRSSS